MADKYYTVRQFLTNRFQERYVFPNGLHKKNLTEKEKKMLNDMKGLLPSIGRILQVSKKAKTICTDKNLSFHKMSRGAFSNSSTYVFPESALKEAIGDDE